MIELKSVTKKQADVGLEAVAAPAEPRIINPGSAGATESVGSNLAADQLLVKGKGDPLPRPMMMGGGALESVIGQDDRTRILETAGDPWRMICALSIQSDYGSFIGTGWFIGPRTLLTAGHCVYEQGMGGWANRIEVSPGRNQDQFPFKTVTATRFSTLDRWMKTQDPDFDMGVIHLDEDLGLQTGWFAIGALPAGELKGYLVNISGYPGDRGWGKQQWFHRNRILRVTARRVFYDVDTYGGQSGSPVWIYESENPQPLAVGIHAYGVGGTPSNFGITANSAPRIIPEAMEVIREWVASEAAS